MQKNSNSLHDDGGDLEPKFVKEDKPEEPGFQVPERFAVGAKSKGELNQARLKQETKS